MYNQTCDKRQEGEGKGKRRKRSLLHCHGMKGIEAVVTKFKMQDLEWEKREKLRTGKEQDRMTTYLSGKSWGKKYLCLSQ